MLLKDIRWLLANLPTEIVRSIIVPYDPLCLLIMDVNWLVKYKWSDQCKILFNYSKCDSLYEYYCICLRFRSRFAKPSGPVVQVSCADYHSVIMKSDGMVMYSGEFPDRSSSRAYVKIRGLPKDISQIVCIENRVIVVRTNGELVVCGSNRWGQLGLEEGTHIYNFTALNEISGVVSVTGDEAYTMIMLANGVLMGCGCGIKNMSYEAVRKFEELMHLPDIVQFACSYLAAYFLKADGALVECGLTENDYMRLTEFPYPKDIVQVACGETHVIILRANGELMSFGDNNFGQLGQGNTNFDAVFKQIKGIPKDITHVACGRNYSMILRSNGVLMACGDNRFGQLGFER